MAVTSYAEQLREWRRKQGQADAMAQSAMNPFEKNPELRNLTGGAQVMTAIKPLAQALFSMKMGKDASQGVSDTIDARQTDLGNQIKEFMELSRGKSAEITPYEQDNPFGQDLPANYNVEPGVQADPQKAIYQAMTSQMPEMQQLGMSALENQSKGAIGQKDLLPYVKPSAIPQMLQGQSVGPDMMKPEVESVDGMLYDPNSLETIQLGGAQPEVQMINNDLYQRNPSTGSWEKLDNATNISVNASPTIQGQKAGTEQFYKNATNQVNELGVTAQKSQELTQSINQLRELDQGGIHSNVTSTPVTFMANLAQSVGVDVDTAKLGNTESYNALINKVWQNLVSQMGGNKGVTAEEAKEIKKMLPLAAHSPQARQQLFDMLEQVSAKNIERYQTANRAYTESVYTDDPRIFMQGTEGIYAPAPGPDQIEPVPSYQGGQSKPTVSNW